MVCSGRARAIGPHGGGLSALGMSMPAGHDRTDVGTKGGRMAGEAGGAGRALLAVGGLVRRAEVSPDGHALYQVGGRDADTFYRDRWSYDKDGIITWESQQTDYPSVGPDRP